MPPATATNPPPVPEEKSTQPDIAAAPAKVVARTETPTRRSAPPRATAGPQSLTVISSPKGAVVTLDGQSDTACTTPCTLEATPGHHAVELQKTGYDVERRDVEVGSSAVELPAVVMRSVQGTLMVTSSPPGATVLVDGKRQAQVTPAQFQLPPGSYSITVEWKDGKKATRTVQIKDGINFEKFLVGQ
jgi:archaellum component FlaF (FlaF/FlaG flagellin family)